jgi:chorismate-pyruvate lyase
MDYLVGYTEDKYSPNLVVRQVIIEEDGVEIVLGEIIIPYKDLAMTIKFLEAMAEHPKFWRD